MYILCLHEMPKLFEERMPFKNASKVDTPLYRSAISVFETQMLDNEPFTINKDYLTFVGFIPYANSTISQESKYKTLRGKTFKDGVYFGTVKDYKVGSGWRHKAIYLFNSNMFCDPSIRFFEKNQRVYTKPSGGRLVTDGTNRDIPADFLVPNNGRNCFYGINIHRGPVRINPKWNLSLGCITVDPEHFDQVMKTFEYDEALIYVHHIDRLAQDKDNYSLQRLPGMDFSTISLMNNVINAQIQGLRLT